MEQRGADSRSQSPALSTSRGNRREIAAWAREWNERSTHLLQLIGDIDHDGLASAVELLREGGECRRLADPPDSELRSLWHRALDEVWEAARSTLYGDLEPARRHADNALGSMQKIREVLQSRAG